MTQHNDERRITGLKKDASLLYMHQRQDVRLVRLMSIVRIPELFDRLLSYEDNHKGLVRTTLYGYTWLDYPTWCGRTSGKKLFMVSKLACTCKELYNKVTLYVNPSLISHDGQVELLNAYEKEFWEKISYIIDPSILDRPKLTCSEEL